jgi:hypothetical protein
MSKAGRGMQMVRDAKFRPPRRQFALPVGADYDFPYLVARPRRRREIDRERS